MSFGYKANWTETANQNVIDGFIIIAICNIDTELPSFCCVYELYICEDILHSTFMHVPRLELINYVLKQSAMIFKQFHHFIAVYVRRAQM